MNYKKRKLARQRAAQRCWCNPHQQALGNTRAGYATREQRRSALVLREAKEESV